MKTTPTHTKALTEMGYCQRVFSASLRPDDVFSFISGKESPEIFIMNWNRNIELLMVQISLQIRCPVIQDYLGPFLRGDSRAG